MTRRLQSIAAAVVTILSVAAPAAAQTGRASGMVRDQNGKPIRSAIVRAENPVAYPSRVTSSTDDKGRFGMIGLASGEWHFVVEAPGYVAQEASLPVRTAGTPGLTFILPRDPGPLPGALDRNIQQQVIDANSLRDQGRLDQAIAAYQDIRTRNQKLTAVNLLLADAYRRKASQERDPGSKRSLLQLAIASYDELLKTDATNELARAELAAARAEASVTTNGINR